MINKGEKDKFEESIIAQDDDNDYEESGWVAVVVGNWAALTTYGHCSCFDTWASITGGGISDNEGPDAPRWDWQGTPAQLVELARTKADPALPGRESAPADHDHDHLMEVYKQILAWHDKQPKPEAYIVAELGGPI